MVRQVPVYLRNEEGKEVRKAAHTSALPQSWNPKWKAEQLLHDIILNETGVPAKTATSTASDSATFRWFVKNGTFRCGKGHGVRRIGRSIPTRSSTISWVTLGGFH